MSREGRGRWDIGSRFVIGKPGNPMMVRVRLLQTPFGGVYLHRIFREDLDRVPHNHPWNFTSLVLRGGYVEEHHEHPRATTDKPSYREWSKYSLHRMRHHEAHRIVDVRPGTLTLIFVGRKQGSWGFYESDGWTDYRDALCLRPREGVSG